MLLLKLSWTHVEVVFLNWLHRWSKMQLYLDWRRQDFFSLDHHSPQSCKSLRMEKNLAGININLILENVHYDIGQTLWQVFSWKSYCYFINTVPISSTLESRCLLPSGCSNNHALAFLSFWGRVQMCYFLGSVSMYLHIIESMVSSVPPPIDSSLKSL